MAKPVHELPLRQWWRNCSLRVDAEISAVDEMEDALAPINVEMSKIRELISSLELCHHKAERWVENIIEAIGRGKTRKGLGTRCPGQQHPVEAVWKNACAALSAWCAGSHFSAVELVIDTVAASEVLSRLGTRSPLKEWQAQRVIEKIRSLINWPWSSNDPSSQYRWILLRAGNYESIYRDNCPRYYGEHEDFWQETVRTIIHDTENGEEAELSLALAIDMLWPCHWRFVENLQLVLGAIGGKLHPQEPFAACGRNIVLLPVRDRMETVSNSLQSFCGAVVLDELVDRDLLTLLREPTDGKRWLAASLDKTIRLQLNPPADLRAISALAGPEWIKR